MTWDETEGDGAAGKYVLDDHGNPAQAASLSKWFEWMNKADRKVARETIGDADVSTVFIGLDLNFSGDGPPVLWETMVFGGPLDQEQDRCSGSREQAEAMHELMVERVRLS